MDRSRTWGSLRIRKWGAAPLLLQILRGVRRPKSFNAPNVPRHRPDFRHLMLGLTQSKSVEIKECIPIGNGLLGKTELSGSNTTKVYFNCDLTSLLQVSAFYQAF